MNPRLLVEKATSAPSPLLAKLVRRLPPRVQQRRDVFGTVSGPSPRGEGRDRPPFRCGAARMNAIGLAAPISDPGPRPRPAIPVATNAVDRPRLAAGRGRVVHGLAPWPAQGTIVGRARFIAGPFRRSELFDNSVVGHTRMLFTDV